MAGMVKATSSNPKLPDGTELIATFEGYLQKFQMGARGEFAVTIALPFEERDNFLPMTDHTGLMVQVQVTTAPKRRKLVQGKHARVHVVDLDEEGEVL
jgi:hypothetical protein